MSASITVTETDNHRSVTLSVGEALVIALNENPTTGFNWRMEPYAQEVLRLESDDYSIGSESGVGGGGIRRLKFRAIGEGHAAIRLRNRRSWEAPEKFADEFALNILVE